MDSADAGALRDAMMITAAQKVEHYEIASDGTVRTYARVLGENAVATLLDHTLKQEKAADQKLPRLRKVRSTDELPGSGRSRPAPRKKRPACCRRAPSGSAPPSAARSQS